MPKPLQISEDIVPLHEFKSNASKLLKRLHQTRRPMVVTQNGRPAAVVITPEEFDLLTYRRRLLDSIQEGLDDIEAGRVYSTAQVREHLRKKIPR